MKLHFQTKSLQALDLEEEITDFMEQNTLSIQALDKLAQIYQQTHDKLQQEQQNLQDLMKKMQDFKAWKYSQVHKCFQIKKIAQWDEMKQWLDTTQISLSDDENKHLKLYQQDLKEIALAWNEATLKAEFIYPLLKMLYFRTLIFIHSLK